MPVPIFLSGLREEFLIGDQGDCTLKFVVSDEVVAERKAESVILKQVPHFKRQLQFAEGKTKVFTIDISDFMEDVTISAKEFVEVSLLVLFDGDVEIDEKIDLASRFGIMKFREYLELPYSEVLVFDCGWNVEKAPGIREFVIHMIKTCSLNLCEDVVRKVLYLLEKDISEMKKERAAKDGGDAEAADAGNDEDGADKEFEFHEKWKVAYDLMIELLQGDSDCEQRGVIVLRNLVTDECFEFLLCNSRDLMCIGGGALELAVLGIHYCIDPWFIDCSMSPNDDHDGLRRIAQQILLFIIRTIPLTAPIPKDSIRLQEILMSDSTIVAMEKYNHTRIAVSSLLTSALSMVLGSVANSAKFDAVALPFFQELQSLVGNQVFAYSVKWNESMRDLQTENQELKKAISESSSSQAGTKRRRVD